MRLDFGIQRKERTVSELEQAVGKNKNSRTRQGREILLLKSRLVKKLDAFSFFRLRIGKKMDLL
ncbi:hypothetical protein PVK06_034535 [Gossypium arboreum]|uniref:Uncharacterized protein n=1 Tax=Gossypium arboreum TaxID=29729 RepID=A0ABR0NEF4_GOSAR|nr:hypothetical protein PVK06_034535 [Gossypium arboreum]